MSVVVIGTVRFKPEDMPKLRPLIKALAEGTRKNDGCIFYDVAEDMFDPGVVRYSELWPSAELLQAHMKAPHVVKWAEERKGFATLDRKFTVYDASNERPL
jgi:quinol monooxygenase YgiN